MRVNQPVSISMGLCLFQKLFFPFAVPHLPLGKKHLGNGAKNVVKGCVLMRLFWCLLVLPALDLCAFPRNARLAFGLRDTNVPEPSCRAGCWDQVVFLGHTGVAFIFGLQ